MYFTQRITERFEGRVWNTVLVFFPQKEDPHE